MELSFATCREHCWSNVVRASVKKVKLCIGTGVMHVFQIRMRHWMYTRRCIDIRMTRILSFVAPKCGVQGPGPFANRHLHSTPKSTNNGPLTGYGCYLYVYACRCQPVHVVSCFGLPRVISPLFIFSATSWRRACYMLVWGAGWVKVGWDNNCSFALADIRDAALETAL